MSARARLLALLAVGGASIALAACSGGSREVATVTVTVREPQTSAPISPRDLRDVARLVEGALQRSRSGHVAYVGADGNVYVVDPLTGATAQVTDDRSSAGTGLGIFHAGLAWSRKGELAFARSDVDSFTSSLFVTVPGSGKVRRVTGERGILIYASWSPAACGRLACSELAYVADGDRKPGGKVMLNVVRVPRTSAPRRLVEQRAAQIYFAWAEERDRLIRHVLGGPIGASSRLEDVDLAAGRATRIEAPLAPFLAPAFTAGRVVYAVADARRDDPTVTLTGSAVVIHVPREARRVAFAPAPDGRRLAFAIRGSARVTPDQAFGHPWIVDLETGKIDRVGPPSLWTEAFYWSPDGTRLAYLTWLDNEIRPYNQWRIFDAAAKSDKGFVAFQPTPTFNTLTTFFDQFGQSHRLWSPDSRYLTYAAVSDEGQEQVWVLDTRRRQQILVADGVVGAFSWK